MSFHSWGLIEAYPPVVIEDEPPPPPHTDDWCADCSDRPGSHANEGCEGCIDYVNEASHRPVIARVRWAGFSAAATEAADLMAAFLRQRGTARRTVELMARAGPP